MFKLKFKITMRREESFNLKDKFSKKKRTLKFHANIDIRNNSNHVNM